MTEHAGEPTGTLFTGLAELIYGGGSYETVFSTLCAAAPALVDGCDHASLMLRRRNDYETAAGNDDIARRIDALEREVGEGPCVDAILDEAYQLDPDIRAHCQWPMLAERILAETPVRGVAGFRLMPGQGGSKSGALNLFSDSPGALTVASADQGVILAAFASVAVTAIEQREEVETLRAGLRSNREIGKAVGLLMAAHKVKDEEAFEILRRASQDLNTKLVEVAAEVVTHHNLR